MMTTYFHGGSEFQAADNNLQTLYLVNPSYGGANYSDGQTPSNMHLLNAAPAQPSHHFVGVPLSSQGSANFWGSTADPAAGGGAQHQIPTAVPVGSGGGGVEVALAPAGHHFRQRGLSLSLNDGSPHENAAGTTAGDGYGKTPAAGGGGGVVLRSKYRAAAQELLDEVVNVEMALTKAEEKRAKAAVVESGEGGGGGMGVGGGEINTAAKHDIQVKKAKLLSMLDEVEQRYRAYQRQMEEVAWAFERAAGAGSSRSYTAVALQTISRQFRCLKDAIAAQIKAAGMRVQGGGSSGLRAVEDEMMTRQRQRQQVEAWRPQRGLPERAVSVLRAWLFEHFLHPYPKDTDKHMLAKQSGLTRSQVSNWFINARVRLWKPMVEEMYLEELKSQDQNTASQDATNTTANTKQNDNGQRNPTPSSTLHPHPQPGSAQMSPPPAAQGFSFIGPNLVGRPMTRQSPKRHRSSDVGPETEIKPAGSEEVGLGHGGYGSYMVEGIGSRFDPDMGHQYRQGNGVSLTLGPPHCEGLSLVTSQAGAAAYDIWD